MGAAGSGFGRALAGAAAELAGETVGLGSARATGAPPRRERPDTAIPATDTAFLPPQRRSAEPPRCQNRGCRPGSRHSRSTAPPASSSRREPRPRPRFPHHCLSRIPSTLVPPLRLLRLLRPRSAGPPARCRLGFRCGCRHSGWSARLACRRQAGLEPWGPPELPVWARSWPWQADSGELGLPSARAGEARPSAKAETAPTVTHAHVIRPKVRAARVRNSSAGPCVIQAKYPNDYRFMHVLAFLARPIHHDDADVVVSLP